MAAATPPPPSRYGGRDGSYIEEVLAENYFPVNETRVRIAGDKFPTNGSVWQQPLESFYLPPVKDLDSVSQGVLVIHGILGNQSFYGTDVLIEKAMDAVGLSDLKSTAVTLLRDSLPSKEDMLVAVSRTDFLNAVFKTSNDAIETMSFEEPDFLLKFADDPMSALPKAIESFVSVPSAALMFDKLAIIAGPVLGPVIKTMVPQLAQSGGGSTSLGDDAELDGLLTAFVSVALKTMLFSPYLPLPCIRLLPKGYVGGGGGSYECLPAENGSDALISVRNQVLDGTLNISDVKTQGRTFDYVAKQIGLPLTWLDVTGDLSGEGNNATQSVAERLIEDPAIKRALSILGEERSRPNAEYFAYFNASSSLGETPRIKIDPAATKAGYSPEAAVCMANLSNAMYEDPGTIKKWADGLGLETVAVESIGDRYSSLVASFISNDTIVMAMEGIPLISYDFFRGGFGWLQTLLDDNLKPFQCTPSSVRCQQAKEAHPGAAVFTNPFMGNSTGSSAVFSVVNEAIQTLADRGVDKPKLYVTGSSDAGRLSKFALLSLLLEDGVGEKVEKPIFLYSFSGPSHGNEAFNALMQEIFQEHGVTQFSIVNSHDYIPYFPLRLFPQRKGTFQFDLTEGILKPFVLDNSSYEPGPSNVDAGFIAYHDSLAQILPLTRATWDEFDPSVCDDVCVRGQCGRFQCRDSCLGAL